MRKPTADATLHFHSSLHTVGKRPVHRRIVSLLAGPHVGRLVTKRLVLQARSLTVKRKYTRGRPCLFAGCRSETTRWLRLD